MSIIPLDKAIRFYELKDQIEKTIYHSFNFITSSSDYDRAMKLLELIESIDATPDKGGAVLKEEKE